MDFSIKGLISHIKPTQQPDGNQTNARLTPYGDIVSNLLGHPKYGLAEEGSYFVTTNPTIGTGVAYALQTSFSDTAALFAIKNTSSLSGSGKNLIYLDHLRLMMTGTAPTGTVFMDFAVKVDGKDRTPTANNATRTPSNVNGDSNAASIADVEAFSAGAITVPASGTAARTVSRCRIPTGLGITGDEYVVQFGSYDHSVIPGNTAVRATDVARRLVAAPPVIIGPGQWGIIFMWWITAAANTPNFEYELAHWER